MSNPTAALQASSLLLTPERKFAEQPSAGEPATAKKGPEPGGWDPFEVWRTRVLLPRLNDRTAAEDLSEILTSSD